ncbi:phenylacetate--CoA ligase, partial [Thioclava sp. BHET1]
MSALANPSLGGPPPGSPSAGSSSAGSPSAGSSSAGSPAPGGLEWRGPGFGQEADDARFRAQIAHLFDHSPFYQRHLRQAGFAGPGDVGGLSGLADLPFTEKDDLRRTRSHDAPVGDHLAVPMSEVTRLYATAGYSGMPSFVPLTRGDLSAWVEIATRCYGAAGLKPGEKILSSFASGPYAGAAALEAFAELGLCYIPSPGADLDRTIAMLQMLRPEILTATPSGALRLAELACAHGMDPRGFGLRRLVLSGEAGGGEAQLRARLEAIWG